jgi:uncharacterized protein with HEPN domain
MKLLLQDIIENSEMIFQFVGAASYVEFINDKMKIYAVIRAFEIIGEASKIISPAIKSAYPLIEWQMMTDFRNLLIHHYFGIEYEILWKTIKESLPYNYELLKQINVH